MSVLTTKDALLERMVDATENLATSIPAKIDECLPLSGGTITGNLEVNGTITQAGKKVATNNWTVQNLIPVVPYTLASWGFCRIAYNENLAMVSFSGLKLTNAYTSPTTIFNLPVSALAYFAFFVYVESSIKICTCTVSGSTVDINGYSTADSYLYGTIVFPI